MIDYKELLAWADKAKSAIYLATEKEPADDISAGISNLAAAIRELQSRDASPASIEPCAWMFRRAYGSGLQFPRPDDYYDEDNELVSPTPLYALPPGSVAVPDTIEQRKGEWARLYAVIQTYADDYEYGENGYTLTELEMSICQDFIYGLISNDDFTTAIAQVYPVRTARHRRSPALGGEGY